jgi:hypothetical protein
MATAANDSHRGHTAVGRDDLEEAVWGGRLRDAGLGLLTVESHLPDRYLTDGASAARAPEQLSYTS